MEADEIRRILDELDSERPDESETASHWIRPLSDTALSLIEQLAADDNRYRFGIASIDLLTRGLGPKELIYLVGFAHSAKTQLFLTSILHNPDKKILFFSLDDPAEMILLKLCCLKHNMAGDVLEKLINQGDTDALTMVKGIVDEFPNLLIVDDTLGTRGMTQALKEAEGHWGAQPDLVAVDYLELLADSAGDDATIREDVKAVSKSLKNWVKKRSFPLLIIHQNTRSRGAPGEPITMLSMAHGGEQEATIIIGVRRQRDNEHLNQFDRDAHRDTVTIHIPKNKRPPSRKTPPEGVDLFIDPLSGLIRPLRESDYRPGLKIEPPTRYETAAAALKAAREKVYGSESEPSDL